MPEADLRAIRRTIKKFVPILKESREANKNEAETVMIISKFLEEAFGYDLLRDVSREFQIRDRYCDLAIKINGQVRFLIEAKDVTTALHEKHIEQAENYASRSGIPWVVLTNAIQWHLYHLTFNDSEGISRVRVLSVDLLAEGADEEVMARDLGILHRESVAAGELEGFWQKFSALGPRGLIRALFSESVLSQLRREVRRETGIMIPTEEILEALKNLLDKTILADLADIKIRKRRRKRRSGTAGQPEGEGELPGESGEDDPDATQDEEEGSDNAGGEAPASPPNPEPAPKP